ncbi:MAG TPA: fatty acid desaturase [Gemmatimonadales bacterium]|nr:fatty acid desaturase [Gemmatimonadales bacterium]
MDTSRHEFAHADTPEPHRARTKEILARHPEIRDLIGHNPTTFFWTVGIVALQYVLAAFVSTRPWWVVFVVAYCAGAFANHALFVMIHECTHRLVFKRKMPNQLTELIANLPMCLPGALSFHKYHLKHHSFQGVYELDADIPSRWEAKLVGHSALGKALWLLLYPVFQIVRPMRVKEVSLLDAWSLTNLGVQILVNVAVYLVWGPKAVVYFLASLFFAIGLHPLGARWIQRHYMTFDGDQETFSYYGKLNIVAFNVGYHNEHHDFPSVAWNKLPRIRAMVPEVYDRLAYHTSWTMLLLRFLFDSKLSLFDRMIRENRNRVTLDDQVTPDADLIAAARQPLAPV